MTSSREKDPLLPKPAVGSATGPQSITDTLKDLDKDAWLLIASKIVRMFSYGFLAVILMIYLQTLLFTDGEIGLLFTLILSGDAVLSILLTSHADRWGRKFTLMIGSVIAILTSFIFSTNSSFSLLLVAGIFGVISPSGSEQGPFMAIELSSLAEVSTIAQRTALMAWYNMCGSLASAFGALACGYLLTFLQTTCQHSLQKSAQLTLLLYTFIQCIQFVVFYFLSDKIESKHSSSASQAGFLGLHKSKYIVLQLSLLFMLDSFGGSFVLQSIISTWFFNTYGTNAMVLGSIVFYCNIAAGLSSLFAVSIAHRIGLIMTMFVTHLPSNVFLILVPLMPTELTSILMLCLRYTISQMDVPTRNAYVQGVVASDERSAANGVTNVVRSVGACLGPVLAGRLLASPSQAGWVFFIAGGLKIVYDILLLYNFMSLRSESDILEIGSQKNTGNKEEKRLVELNRKV